MLVKETLALITKESLSFFEDNSCTDTLKFINDKLEIYKLDTAFNKSSLLYDFSLYIYRQNPADAISILQESIKCNQENIRSKVLLALLLDQFGKQELSVEIMLSVVKSSSALPREKIQASNLLVRSGYTELAHKVSKQAYYNLQDKLPYLEALLYIAMITADWDFADELKNDILVAYESGEFCQVNESPRTNLLWCSNENYNIDVALNWVQNSFPQVQNVIKPQLISLKNRKIKIGYLSSDFRDHPTSKLIKGLLKNHNKEGFEIYMYCSGWNDQSLLRKEIESYCDEIYSVTNLSDQEASNLIRDHQIDVLVELNGLTRANRMGILRYKPAPLLVNYLGWPGGIGGDLVDYIVADKFTIPEQSLKKYKDKIIRIDKTYQVNDYSSETNLSFVTKQQFNLPSNQMILGMFNSVNKLNNLVWNCWMQIMKQVPNSILWLLDPGETAFEHIQEKTKSFGVDSSRIIIAPHLDEKTHLIRLQLCDLILDPWPYGGHTSTSDALFAKVPVIVLEGENFAGRVSSSLLKAASLDLLICSSINEYIIKAVDLLKDPFKLNLLKQRIKNNIFKSDIFDATSKTLLLEQAFALSLERISKNLPLQNINLNLSQTNKPFLSIVTVCKNRLDHLKQSLPKMCEQSNSEVIVVDYGCEQGTSKWVQTNYPQVKLIRTEDSIFNLPRARNLGSYLAQGDMIMFIDADIILQVDIGKWAQRHCTFNNYYKVGEPSDLSTTGTYLGYTRDFFKSGMYDEVFIGWGGEDIDLYMIFQHNQINTKTFPSSFVKAIFHDDSLRDLDKTKSHEAAKLDSHKIHSMYSRIKYDLIRLNGNIPNFNYRLDLMNQIKEKIKSSTQPATIEITFEPQGLYNLGRKITYTME